jgi:ABC-type transport system involved in cytochrome bd biosynthesis fused ATPase/permease subunit
MSTASASNRSGAGMAGLMMDLARPYRVWLVIILAAMVIETILVLHEGIVAEQGTHDELLARGGIYAGLYGTTPAALAELRGSRPTQPTTTDLAWRAR